MSDEEEDYMSEKFLSSVTDVRESLVRNRVKKHKLEVEKSRQENIKRQRMERDARTGADRNERLQESLSRPIEQSNKGFQMLAKMGYKSGEALGKGSSSAAEAIKEPIGISIKMDRGGLGREAALVELEEKRQKKREEWFQRKRKDAANVTLEEYRSRACALAEERWIRSALRKCQAACENIEADSSAPNQPAMPWFWPERLEPEKEQEGKDTPEETVEENEGEDYSDSEKLEMLSSYLRRSYNYCNWCGVRYNDENDLLSNCPGLTREDH